MSKEDLYRYKVLYEIILEENKLLKEKNIEMQHKIIQLEQQNQQQANKKNVLYRGFKKIYHIVKR